MRFSTIANVKTIAVVGAVVVAGAVLAPHGTHNDAETRTPPCAYEVLKAGQKLTYQKPKQEQTAPKPEAAQVNYKYQFKQDLPRISGCESVIHAETLEMHKVGEFVNISCRADLNDTPCDIFALYDSSGKIIQLKINNHAVYTRGGNKN